MGSARARVFTEGWHPDDTERRRISEAFAEAGLEGVQPEQPSMERQSTMEWVVIAVPLMPFIQAISAKAGGDAYAALKTLVGRLKKSGGGRGVRTVELTDPAAGMAVDLRGGDLPDPAWRALSQLSIGPIERPDQALVSADDGYRGYVETLTLRWSDHTNHWMFHPDGLAWAGRHIGRRLPVTPTREPLDDARLPAPLDLTSHQPADPYLSPTWAYFHSYPDENPSAISALRARLVGYFSLGNAPGDIARHLLCSRELISAVLDDFAHHGLQALDPEFADSRARSTFTLSQHAEMVEIATKGPPAVARGEYLGVGPAPWAPRGASRSKRSTARLKKRDATWGLDTLGDFLVSEGVVEDLTLPDLARILTREGIHAEP